MPLSTIDNEEWQKAMHCCQQSSVVIWSQY